MAPLTVKDILSYHKIDREVYEKFVVLVKKPGTAHIVVALFMVLERGGPDASTVQMAQMRRINMIAQIAQITNPNMIFTLIAEAEAVLRFLRQHDAQRFNTEIPMITSLAENRLDIRFFNSHRDLIVRGLVYILDGVGRVVFNDYMYDVFRVYESKEEAARAGLCAVMPVIPPSLALLYDPAAVPSIEDDRSMFITFSKDFPISEDEILESFTK